MIYRLGTMQDLDDICEMVGNAIILLAVTCNHEEKEINTLGVIYAKNRKRGIDSALSYYRR